MAKSKPPALFRKKGKDYLYQEAPDIINELLRCSIQSCRLPAIMVPKMKHKGQFFPVRAQLHTLLLGDFGQFKSTRLKAIPSEYSLFLQNVTRAAFFGSITDKGEANFGVLEECAGKVLVLDEVQNLPDEVRDATLALLEDQFYNRRVASLIKTPIHLKNKFMEVDGFRGSIKIRGRFSCVSGGLPIIRKQYGNDWAWFSRFAPIRFLGTREDAYRGLRDGYCSDSLQSETPFDERLQVTFPGYQKFIDAHESLTGSLAFLDAPTFEQIKAAKEGKKKSLPDFTTRQAGAVTRNSLEIIRIAALHALRKHRTEINEDDWHKAMAYAPTLLYNLVALNLTQQDYMILSRLLADESPEKIGSDLELTDEHIRIKRAEFQERGLLP